MSSVWLPWKESAKSTSPRATTTSTRACLRAIQIPGSIKWHAMSPSVSCVWALRESFQKIQTNLRALSKNFFNSRGACYVSTPLMPVSTLSSLMVNSRRARSSFLQRVLSGLFPSTKPIPPSLQGLPLRSKPRPNCQASVSLSRKQRKMMRGIKNLSPENLLKNCLPKYGKPLSCPLR